MGWQVGFDSRWNRDIGYGVPAICDYPGCGAEINRGLSYVCGGEPYGGEDGCGLYFCDDHMPGWASDAPHHQLCERCSAGEPPFKPAPDTAEWLNWKLADESWAEWRRQNPGEAERIRTLAEADAGRGGGRPMTIPAPSPRRALTPVTITERYPNPRTGKLEDWAAVSVERSEDDRPVWEYNRIEDAGTIWWVRYVPAGEGVLCASLPKARASTASGSALALIEARRKEVA